MLAKMLMCPLSAAELLAAESLADAGLEHPTSTNAEAATTLIAAAARVLRVLCLMNPP
jgi:hypothetical protein